MNSTIRIALYCRVSTTDQDCAMQLAELREYAARRGWEIAGEYVDTGFSGVKASRPALDRLMKDAAKRKFDCLAVWKIDRFSRSMLHLNQQLAALDAAGVRFIATSQAIDTDQTNPTSRLLLNVLSSIAEFERSMILERVTAGVRRAQKHGTKSGKAIGRPKRVFSRDEVARRRAGGQSIESIAREMGIGVGTVSRTLQAAA